MRPSSDLKKVLINTPTLQCYDVSKPVVVNVGALKHGLRAVLLQDKLPVAYASRALTVTETRYAQIDKEAGNIYLGRAFPNCAYLLKKLIFHAF